MTQLLLPTARTRVKLRLEFDGSLFGGWQLQSADHEARKPSVQGQLEKSLGVLLRSRDRVVVQGCGRTDAGVSAREFFAHCDLDARSTLLEEAAGLEKLRHSLNGLLPEAIAVTGVDKAPAAFHALRSVEWKTYEYTLLLRRTKATIDRATCYWIPESPETFRWEEVRRCLRALVGTRDFVAFAAADHSAQTTVREIHAAEMRVEAVAEGDAPGTASRVRLRFSGNGFLKQMVRTLVGTLVEVGQGKRDLASVERLFSEGATRPDAGFCAPAQALCLVRVSYEERACG